jgi:hypothetical protein
MRPSTVFGGAAILLALAVGCSTNSSAPDASLSYEVVGQNASQYEGKRVRWYGLFQEGEIKPKTEKGSTVNALFTANTTDPRDTIRVFAVEAESQKDTVSLLLDLKNKPCWVTGTVAGTRKVKFNIPVYKEVEVPLLRDAQFEQAPGSPVK